MQWQQDRSHHDHGERRVKQTGCRAQRFDFVHGQSERRDANNPKLENKNTFVHANNH